MAENKPIRSFHERHSGGVVLNHTCLVSTIAIKRYVNEAKAYDNML
ncbi:hypothetical protein FHR85_000647 [Alkalibacillus almallahensis]|nr:hypothetical protein [Alkalibacillus almallahensis]